MEIKEPVSADSEWKESMMDEGGIGVVEKRFDYNTPYRDLISAILFFASFVSVIIIAAYYGTRVKDYDDDGTPNNRLSSFRDRSTAIAMLTVSAITTALWSRFLLHCILSYSSRTILIMLVFYISLGVTLTILALSTGAFVIGAVSLMYCIIASAFVYARRACIPFTQLIFHTSALSLQKYSGPFWILAGLAYMAIGWMLLSWYALVAVVQVADQTGGLTGTGSFLIAYLLVSVYWGAKVLMNISYTSTSGVVATFLFRPRTSNPNIAALKRSLTTSFGSICFGSITLAPIAFVHAFVYRLRVILSSLAFVKMERVLRGFQEEAFVVVALYGYSFLGSGSQTLGLLEARGADVLLSNQLTGVILLLGKVTGAIVACIFILWQNLITSLSASSTDHVREILTL